VGDGRGGHDDAVDARREHPGRPGSDLDTEPLTHLPGEVGDGVGDDELVDHGQVGEGLRVERTDASLADQSDTHGAESSRGSEHSSSP